MSKIHGFGNDKIERHNGTSRSTYAIALHIHFSHIHKNNVMSP